MKMTVGSSPLLTMKTPTCLKYKFDGKDLKSFTYSNSLRYSNFYNPSNLAEDPNIELFVHREQDHQGSSRSNINSLISEEKGKKEETLIQADGDGDRRLLLHKFKHKIIVSDVVIKNRWSDVSSSDLLFLNSEMLNIMSSNRFSKHNGFSIDDSMDKIKEDIERKRLYESKLSRIDRSLTISASNLPSTSFSDTNSLKLFDPVQKRSQSEITNFSRFKQLSVKNRNSTESSSPGTLDNGKEERIRSLWLPIARRTVQWFAGRERSLEESDCRKQPSNV
ncbi:E3 ubiquitin-protein ligase ATL42-like [Tripterygium wilfordii]|uniref:E3 ubiquitin-protein ligase ATL42-like n=1 Tax=Tripterygium wilfordii TaxID=458696 RepID=A0A7J7DAG8_TRIWF|nr:E3 ubiquitin-protein ligase ATL42-like [Tripterygium wilfordii]